MRFLSPPFLHFSTSYVLFESELVCSTTLKSKEEKHQHKMKLKPILENTIKVSSFVRKFQKWSGNYAIYRMKLIETFNKDKSLSIWSLCLTLSRLVYSSVRDMQLLLYEYSECMHSLHSIVHSLARSLNRRSILETFSIFANRVQPNALNVLVMMKKIEKKYLCTAAKKFGYDSHGVMF